MFGLIIIVFFSKVTGRHQDLNALPDNVVSASSVDSFRH